MPSYESSRLAAIVMRTGKLFLQYGGDVSSVADTMKQICNTQPWVRNPECIVTPTSLLFSFKAGDQIITRICEVPQSGNNLQVIEAIHLFSEKAGDQTMEQMERSLDRIAAIQPWPRWVRVLASGFCSLGFGLFFGDPMDIPVIFFLGLGAGWILTARAHRIFLLLAASFFITAVPSLLHRWGLPINTEICCVANVPLMVPGMLILNAIRDTINDKYQAGLQRTAEACLIGVAIAAGTGIAMWMLHV